MQVDYVIATHTVWKCSIVCPLICLRNEKKKKKKKSSKQKVDMGVVYVYDKRYSYLEWGTCSYILVSFQVVLEG